MIKIASSAGINKIDAAFNLAIIVEISSALLGAVRILITEYLAVFQHMTVALLAKRDSLSLRAGILHRDVFHIKIGRIDGERTASAAVGLDLIVLAGIIDHLAIIIVPSDDNFVHIFTNETDNFVARFPSVPDEKFFFVSTVFHQDARSLPVVWSRIQSRLNSGKIAAAILGHHHVVRLGKFHCNSFAAKAIDISLQSRITAGKNQISIGRIGRIQTILCFPSIVHAVVVVVGHLFVGFVLGITTHIRRLIDDTGSSAGHTAAMRRGACIHFVDNASIHHVARKSTRSRQHTIVGILRTFSIHRIRNFERTRSHQLIFFDTF